MSDGILLESALPDYQRRRYVVPVLGRFGDWLLRYSQPASRLDSPRASLREISSDGWSIGGERMAKTLGPYSSRPRESHRHRIGRYSTALTTTFQSNIHGRNWRCY